MLDYFASVIQKNWRMLRTRKKYNFFKRLPSDVLYIITNYISTKDQLKIRNSLIDVYLRRNKQLTEYRHNMARQQINRNIYLSVSFYSNLTDDEIFNHFRIKQIKNIFKSYNVRIF